MSEQKKLYRDTENGKIFGVCAGLADYFSVDVTIIRVLCVFLVLCGTIGLWPYIILAILIEPKSVVLKREQDNIVLGSIREEQTSEYRENHELYDDCYEEANSILSTFLLEYQRIATIS